jgi:DNA-binding response OmpR family regulator
LIGLVILDLTMPVMAGKETLQHLRAIREVPVILSSGYNEAEAKRRFATESLAGFVHKPYTSSEIRARVDAVLAPETQHDRKHAAGGPSTSPTGRP